jgi:TrmH family RNA methyltransferase
LIEAARKDLDLRQVVASSTYMNERGGELDGLGLEQISVVDDKLFSELMTTTTSCGVLAIAKIPKQDRKAFSSWQPRVIAVADALQDPGNLGTIIRTAFAAQLGGLLVLKGSVDLYNPKVVRAAAGALFALPILSDVEAYDAVAMIKANKYRLISCEASARKHYFQAELSDSVAVVLGNEGQGINETMHNSAHESISIPMNPQSESLNVAISGGIILFETLKQRLAVANK